MKFVVAAQSPPTQICCRACFSTLVHNRTAEPHWLRNTTSNHYANNGSHIKMAGRIPMEGCTGLRKSFGGSSLRWPRSAFIAPTSKVFLFICQANKNHNGFLRFWLGRMPPQELKIKPLTRLFFET